MSQTFDVVPRRNGEHGGVTGRLVVTIVQLLTNVDPGVGVFLGTVCYVSLANPIRENGYQLACT